MIEKNKGGYICDALKEACKYLTFKDKEEIADETGIKVDTVRAIIRQIRYRQDVEKLLIIKCKGRLNEAIETNAKLLTN